VKALEMAAVAVLMLAADAVAGGYRPANDDEVEVFAAALRSEYAANHWRAGELICFSVGGKDPSGKLVAALRRRGPHVCSQAEWRKRLACRFTVYLQPVEFNSPDSARVRFASADFREVNEGIAHLVDGLREGEYVLRKTNGAWSVLSYTPDRTFQH
jgi:hypothetical protein